jgi:dienelactone hydrolase
MQVRSGTFFGIGLAVLTLVSAGAACAQETVTTLRGDGASVPLRVFPPAGSTCPPLAVISPGVGGNEKGLGYLGRALSAGGWMAIVVGHKESGPTALRVDVREAGLHAGLLRLTSDAAAYRARFADIDAALRWANARCKAPFVALIGHSMGAATVMLEAGAKNKLGLQGLDRFDAYVALSPQGPGSIFPEAAWHGIRKPVLMMTGTRDQSIERGWEWRTLPYADLAPGCKWLGVVEGAGHMNFAGKGFARETEDRVVRVITAFLDSLRRGGCGTPPSAPGMYMQTK